LLLHDLDDRQRHAGDDQRGGQGALGREKAQRAQINLPCADDRGLA
jgi:hypothetical protein